MRVRPAAAAIFFAMSLQTASALSPDYASVVISLAGDGPAYRFASINNRGEVVYRTTGGTRSIKKLDARGVTRTIASRSSNNGAFSFLQNSEPPVINDSGHVAFTGVRNSDGIESPQSGLFVGNGDFAASLVLLSGEMQPISAIANPQINDLGRIIFAGQTTKPSYAIYSIMRDGSGLTTLIDDSGKLKKLTSPFQNNSDEFYFHGQEKKISGSKHSGLYDTKGNRFWGTFSNPSLLQESLVSLNNPGVSVFGASSIGASGTFDYYLFVGGVPVIKSGDLPEFTEFDFGPSKQYSAAINDQGDAVFVGKGAGGDDAAVRTLLLRKTDGTLTRVISSGDLLPGANSPVKNIGLARKSINNVGQIAACLEFQDGVQAVVRLDPRKLPNDRCPSDPIKMEPGTCGCGVPDSSDDDEDSVVNCLDACPQDKGKSGSVGKCGCNVPDIDSNHDGLIDCGKVKAFSRAANPQFVAVLVKGNKITFRLEMLEGKGLSYEIELQKLRGHKIILRTQNSTFAAKNLTSGRYNARFRVVKNRVGKRSLKSRWSKTVSIRRIP